MGRTGFRAGSIRSAPGLLTLAALLLAASAIPALAADERESADKRQIARIEVGEPEGFSALTKPQSVLADIWFGGKRLGEAMVRFQPGSLRFEDPAAVAALIPTLSDKPAVLLALSDNALAANADLVCMPGADAARCGRLSPEVAGVIFDEGRFRADLFVNPRLLERTAAIREQYVERPQAGLSVVDSVSAVVSGAGNGERFYNVQNRLILGSSEARLRAETAYASEFGVQADRLVIELDKPGKRYSAGAFWTPGTDMVVRRKMLGLGVETQFDTRLDKDAMRGNPITVFLSQRAKVDIVRDGRVIATRFYEAGNQGLDTSALPDGSYEVVLRIVEAGGGVREERRFFTRNRQIAPVGHAINFAYAGVLVDDFSRQFLAPTGTPFVQVGTARRLGPRLAYDLTVMATDEAVLGQAGITLLSQPAQFRLAGLASSNGSLGGLFGVSSTGNSRFNFDFELRHVGAGHAAPSLLAAPGAGLSPFGFSGIYGVDQAQLPVARATFTQISGSAGYSFNRAQIGLAGTWRREQGLADYYSIGPWLRAELLRKGPWQVSLSGNYSATSYGNSGFVGLGLRLLGPSASLAVEGGMRTRRFENADRETDFVGSVSGSWQRTNPAGVDIELGAGYEHDLDRNLLHGRTLLRARQAQLTGEISHNLEGIGGSTQYGIGLQTTLVASGSGVSLVGRDPNESTVMVDINGAPPNSSFEVLVNDAPSGTVQSGEKLSLALTPYRQYDVRIRPTGDALLHYDGSARRVGLYPGTVARLEWSARKVHAMFGRLAYSGGEPVAGASIRTEGGIGQTDDNGYFQIEAAEGAALDVSLPNGRSCRVQPPQVEAAHGYAAIGTLTCDVPLHSGPYIIAARIDD